jgi:hypothetical protein
MKVISQKLSASMPTMPIIHTKERTFRPVFMLSVFRFDYVQNYRHSIFIISSDKPLISIRSIRSNDAVSSQTTFSGLVIRDNDSCTWLKRKFPCIFLIALDGSVFLKHLINVKSCERLNLSMHTCCRIDLLLNRDIFLIIIKESFQVQFAVCAISSYASRLVAANDWGWLRWHVLRK